MSNFVDSLFSSLSAVPGIIAVVLVFGGLIFFHELGHFLVARLFGMGVQTFSIGFGKRIFSKKYGQTTYQLAMLPLGGYVALVGETPDAELPEGFTDKDSLSLRPAWQRICVIAAGAVFNLILAVLVCWFMAASDGRIEVLPKIDTVSENSPAQVAGLMSGDMVLAIDGKVLSTWQELPDIVRNSEGRELSFTIQRDGQEFTRLVTPEKMKTSTIYGEEVTTWLVGISPAFDATRSVSLSFGESFVEGLSKAKGMIYITWRVLVGLVGGSISADNISGPLGITKVIYDESGKGVSNLLFLAAFISVNLGVLNLLPIPVLDGGHILFILLEMILRRPVSVAIREKASLAGLALLLGLMLFATYNDIGRFMGWDAKPATEQTTTTNGTGSP